MASQIDSIVMPLPLPDVIFFKNNLDTLLVGRDIQVYDAVSSTNDLAKDYLRKNQGEDGLVIIADSQTGGRGRLGRSWFSPPGLGVYLSVIFKPQGPPERFPLLTLMACVAALEAINEIASPGGKLKWPNDIYLSGKKLCGVLGEFHPPNEGSGGVVVGIGINTNQNASHFPEELAEIATSLFIEYKVPVDRTELILSLLAHLDQGYERYLLGDDAGLIKKWTEHTDMFGKEITLNRGSEQFQGTALRLDSLGRLVLQFPDGREQVFESGEITRVHP